MPMSARPNLAEMDQEDGLIWVYGTGDEGGMAFTGGESGAPVSSPDRGGELIAGHRPIDVPTDQPFNAAMSTKTETRVERFAVASIRSRRGTYA